YCVQIHYGEDYPSRVVLPFTPPRDAPLALPRLEPPAPDLSAPEFVAGHQNDRIVRELTSRKVSFESDWKKEYRLDADTRLTYTHQGVISTDADRPWLTTMRTTTRCELQRPVQSVVTIAKCLLTPFDGHVTGEILVDGELYYQGSWDKSFAADHQ